jgi:hypothetical protein
MTYIDLDRLHAVVQSLESGHRYGEGVGYTFAYEQLLLGEVRLADPRSCFVYVGTTHDAAQTMLHSVWYSCRNEYVEVVMRTHNHLYIPTTEQDYFFVGLESFLHPYTFMGTQVDRIFFDVATDVQHAHDEAIAMKLQHFVLRGTDII